VAHDALLPSPPAGLAPGAALALLVHVGLIGALTLVVDWHMRAPEPVSAELWAAVPQVAAPRAEQPAPPPPPPTPAPAPAPPPAPIVKEAPPADAQIAIEHAKQRKLEQAAASKALAEAERKKREAEETKAAEIRLAKARDEQMKRMFGSIPASGASTGTASQDAAPSQAYVGRLIARIKQNVVFTDTVAGNPAAEVEVRADASGNIMARRLIHSSGVKEWDEAVLRAIDRTGTLPRDTDGRVPPTIIVAFRPKE